MRTLSILMIILIGVSCLSAEAGVRPAGEMSNDTIAWMKKVGDWQLTQSSWDSSTDWLHGALFAGMMALYEATHDELYLTRCREWAEKFNWRMASNSWHGDNNACGQTYLELYLLDQADPMRYAHSKTVNDEIAAAMPVFNCDISGGSRVWWWCDALFMHPPVMARLTRALNDTRYTTVMHAMWEDCQNCLYDQEDHLFFRDINYFYPEYAYNGKKVFWARGNGWVVGGLCRVLQYLDADDPMRTRYETLLQEMAARLASIQQPDGYWYANLLSPEQTNCPETSGTGFFCYGIAWGINNGLLDEATYGPVAERAWDALKAAVREDGLLGWVQPVGAGPAVSTANSTQVYGVGAYLLAGSEMQKYYHRQDASAIDFYDRYVSDAGLRAVWQDGSANGTTAEITLGNYGDRFMELSYHNDQAPWRAETTLVFEAARHFNGWYYLSLQVRGDAGNSGESVYVSLEDAEGGVATQIMSDPAVVQTAAWTELGFALREFAGINLSRIVRLTVGVGQPQAVTSGGSGMIRIDSIQLAMEQCRPTALDFNQDCRVNLGDLEVMAGQWQERYAQIVEPEDPGTEHLSAWWAFDESEGDLASDSSGHGLVGTLYDGAVMAPESGKIGGAVRISGSSNTASRVEIPADALSLNECTVAFWVRPDQNQAPSTRYLFGHTRLNSWGNRIQLYMDNGDTNLDLGLGGSHSVKTGIYNLPRESWSHIALSWDGTNYQVYINGLIKASGPYSVLNELQAVAHIGNDGGNGFSGSKVEAFNGLMDDVRIYNTVLTQPQVMYLAETPLQIQIDHPRPTDVYQDGKIDVDDLKIFIDGWGLDTLWP